MNADLIVVGAGICGSAAARHARARGVDVLHIAPNTPPHSVAAAAILRASWLPKPLQPTLTATLAEHAHAHTCDGAIVTSTYRHPWLIPTHQPDWHLIDPNPPLEAPTLHASVTAATSHPWGVHLTTTTGDLTARAAVLATGATSSLSPQGTITWGTTWLGPVDDLTRPDHLRIHHYATYKAISAGPAGGYARVGSSSGRTPEAALKNAHTLLARAHEANLLHTPDAYTPVTGARLNTTDHIQRHGRALYWVGGHHRLGYALGPADARAAVDAALEDTTS